MNWYDEMVLAKTPPHYVTCNRSAVIVHNLALTVEKAEIQSLFSALGQLEFVQFYPMRAPVSAAVARVMYKKREDAFEAVRTYNGVDFKGRVMKVGLQCYDYGGDTFHTPFYPSEDLIPAGIQRSGRPRRSRRFPEEVGFVEE